MSGTQLLGHEYPILRRLRSSDENGNRLKDEKTKKEFEARFYGKNGKKQEINSKEQVDQILKDHFE